MCGIVGGFAFASEFKYASKIEQSLACIHHRGPDGHGIFSDANVVLGHKRLSIIDTSTAANQPMHSSDGRYAIVFNGEIFNYRTLANQYLKDYAFRTSSDTEVLLALFIQQGPECFSLLRGFFALAIYDKKESQLFVARDRYGKKPIHFYQDEEAFLFASELKALLAFGIPKELDKQALASYLQFNYLPQPLSFIKGVKKAKPGYYYILSASGVEEHQYYNLKVHPDSYAVYTYEEAQKKLQSTLEEATKLRLIADVPLGAFLSGGIDSSVVVGLASRHIDRLHTFSIGFKDNPYFDETAYAELVAKRFKTDHTVFRLGNDDFLEHIDDILNAIDEPFADSSLIPTYILSKYTRKHVTVALSGDGGDEIFAGYNKHKAEMTAMRPSSFSKSVVKGLLPLWNVLPKSRNNKLTNTIRQLHRFAQGASLPASERYWRWASILPEEDAAQLLRFDAVQNSELKKFITQKLDGSDFNEVLLADFNLVLLGDMLVKTDMMSMANSLEIRSPFLDQEVVDFAFGLPVEYKINDQMKKRIVQDAFREMLPAELYNRPKQGFDVPLLQWFRNDLWSRIDNDLIADRFIEEQGLFDPFAVKQLKKRLKSNDPGDSHETLWALIVFQHWWRRTLQA